MTTHFNYSLQDFSMNNAKVLTGNRLYIIISKIWIFKKR